MTAPQEPEQAGTVEDPLPWAHLPIFLEEGDQDGVVMVALAEVVDDLIDFVCLVPGGVTNKTLTD